MDCSAARESLSATLDGEASKVSVELVQQHLARCDDCREWSAAATRLHRTVRVTEAQPVPDLRPRILAAMARVDDSPTSAAGIGRIVLGLCALVQLVACLPAFIGTTGGPIHLDHELGSWDAALAVGLLVAALRPARAWGMLPLVGAIAFALSGTAVLDVATGHTSVSDESVHLMELIGLFFLWSVARTHPAGRIGPKTSQLQASRVART